MTRYSDFLSTVLRRGVFDESAGDDGFRNRGGGLIASDEKRGEEIERSGKPEDPFEVFWK